MEFWNIRVTPGKALVLNLGSPLESLSTNGGSRVYRSEYTWQQMIPLTQLNLSMQARDLARMLPHLITAGTLARVTNLVRQVCRGGAARGSPGETAGSKEQTYKTCNIQTDIPAGEWWWWGRRQWKVKLTLPPTTAMAPVILCLQPQSEVKLLLIMEIGHQDVLITASSPLHGETKKLKLF